MISQTRNHAERVAAAPRVSVITIFLNAERFISEAIESVLTQDFCDFEIILVDDGSTQECTTIARDYAQRYAPIIRYLEHPGHQNRGMSASRNLGVAAARGEFVAFIDADDVWEKNKLTEQLAIMDRFPELGMVCGAARYWSSWNGGDDQTIPTGHLYNRVILPPNAALALYPLSKASAPCPSDLLLRRELIASLGGFEEHFTGPRQLYEDQAFLAKLYLAAPVYFADRVLAELSPACRFLFGRSRAPGSLPRSAALFLDLAGSVPDGNASTARPKSVRGAPPRPLALPPSENARRDQPLGSDLQAGVALDPPARNTRPEQARINREHKHDLKAISGKSSPQLRADLETEPQRRPIARPRPSRR